MNYHVNRSTLKKTGTTIYEKAERDRMKPLGTTATMVIKQKIQHFLLHKEKHKNPKEAYTYWSKNTGKKVGFAAVFEDITRRGALPEDASIHTAETTAIKIAIREIQNEKT